VGLSGIFTIDCLTGFATAGRSGFWPLYEIKSVESKKCGQHSAKKSNRESTELIENIFGNIF
jgi:hypothetical protein